MFTNVPEQAQSSIKDALDINRNKILAYKPIARRACEQISKIQHTSEHVEKHYMPIL